MTVQSELLRQGRIEEPAAPAERAHLQWRAGKRLHRPLPRSPSLNASLALRDILDRTTAFTILTLSLLARVLGPMGGLAAASTNQTLVPSP